MLSDEEKKAIEMIEHIQECNTLIGYRVEDRTILAKALLNLIKKQSKEIEHQKEKRENQKKELAILNAKQVEFNKLVNTVNSYKGQFKRQQKEIEELKETLRCTQNSWYEDTKIIDKIKAKIEEVKDGTFDAKIVLQSLLKDLEVEDD